MSRGRCQVAWPAASGGDDRCLRPRRLDVIGVVVLAGILVGMILGLTSHNARLYLLEGSLPSVVFALACLLSVRLRRPLIFRLAVELLGPDTPKGRDVTAAWRHPGFRRAFRAITVAWGVGYLVEAGIRVAIVAATSTGIALICSKLVPYAFALGLSGWTLVYGEQEKRKAERLAGPAGLPAPPVPGGSADPAAPPYTLVRCPGR